MKNNSLLILGKLLPVVASDRYLLCSDGLFNELEVDQIIAEILLSEDLELVDVAQILVRINALEAGGNDNVTVLVVAVWRKPITSLTQTKIGFYLKCFQKLQSQPLLSAIHSIDKYIRNFEWKPIAIGLCDFCLLIVSVFGPYWGYTRRSGWFVLESRMVVRRNI